jgi:hypothetical protein
MRVVIVLSLLVALAAACRVEDENPIPAETVIGSGQMDYEQREVSGYSRVQFDASGNVVVYQGEREGVAIDADANILPLIVTRVRGDTLRVSFEKDGRAVSVEPTRPIEVSIYVRELRAITVNGAAMVTANGIATSAVEVTSAGAGTLTLHNITAQAVTGRISGNGAIDLAGTTERLTVNISGAGNVRGADLVASEASVTISGAGLVVVNAERELNVRISGNGSVEYLGDPRISERIDGIGIVKRHGT